MSLPDVYRAYIACLNRQDWANLGRYVAENVEHNGRAFGLSGYRRMLEDDFAAIPDLGFHIDLLVCEPPRIAARLWFRCSPRSEFLGLRIDGRTVGFAENVIYEFRDGRIATVWSVVDKPAIEAQLDG
jgi:predicted ester cyclase